MNGKWIFALLGVVTPFLSTAFHQDSFIVLLLVENVQWPKNSFKIDQSEKANV